MADRIISSEQELQIASQYRSGLNQFELARMYGVSQANIWRRLQRQHVVTRSNADAHRRYCCNYRFFSQIDTEPKAYWLGFLAADGCVLHSRKQRVVRVALASRDRAHLLRLTEALQSDLPIRDYEQSQRTAYSRLQIVSPEMVADLALWGIVPRKSDTLPWPSLSQPLLTHYLRGYFDGDGCFTIDKRYGTLSFGLMANLGFAQDCQHYLMERCTLRETKMDRRRPDCPSFGIRYCGTTQVARIYDLLYQDATVWLPRKRETADRVLG